MAILQVNYSIESFQKPEVISFVKSLASNNTRLQNKFNEGSSALLNGGLFDIKVKKGDTVTINFMNKEGIHDWVIDEFGVRTPKIQAGQSASVTFVADKTGTFEYYCSVGSHRARGMRGNLIVE